MIEYEVYRWPVCEAPRRFEYKIHLDDCAGECGHRLTCQQAIEQGPAVHQGHEADRADHAQQETAE